MSTKTHYRKVFKSDHLGVADLEDFTEEGVNLEFTIKHVKQEIGVVVAGRRGNYNIAYFVEQIKPLVLNATNSKTVKSFCKGSPFVEDWKNVRVTLWADASVKLMGDIVGGIRIREYQPLPPKPFFEENKFQVAHEKKFTIQAIKKSWQITPVMEKKYLEYVAKN